MLQRLYVHNYRCLENFEFRPGPAPSSLLIGRNGTGKSNVARVLKIFQHIGRGTNRVGSLLNPADFAMGQRNVPIRLELEVTMSDHIFRYEIAFELPKGFRELRVLDESLEMDGAVAFVRKNASVTLPSGAASRPEAKFGIDWHLIALPVIQDPSIADPLRLFRQWLARMLILAPIPKLMEGDSTAESLEPAEDCHDFADWLSGLLSQYPAAYSTISDYLKQVMPDIAEFKNLPTGNNAKSLVVHFEANGIDIGLPFKELSDGEKCFFLCAVVLAANRAYGPVLAFWDEPDNYLSLSEVGHFILALRRGFQRGGQIIVTSHNEETIRKFSDENTWVLDRKSHLEPAVIRMLADLTSGPDVVQALLRGEI
jgi:predicted ATPase